MPPWTIGRVIALVVFLVCVVLIILALVGVGTALPAWLLYLLIGLLAVALLV
jgi:hypothetical protein